MMRQLHPPGLCRKTAAAALITLLGAAAAHASPTAPRAGTLTYATIHAEDNASARHPTPRFTHRALPLGPGGQRTGAEQQITADTAGFEAIWPAPKGTLSVALTPVEPGARPVVLDRATGTRRTLFEDYPGGSFFGWHPDGERFLFWIDTVGLFLVPARGGEPQRLANPASPVQGAALSPDGRTVAFIATNLPASAGALFVVSTKGGEPRALFDAGAVSYLYPRAFSPDGTRLLYYGSCGVQNLKGFGGGPLCVADLKTGERRALALPFAAYPPHWSPDGTRIAATGRSGGESTCSRERALAGRDEVCLYEGYAIYTEVLATGTLEEVARGIAPVFSPDGKALAFLSHQSGASEVWTVDLASNRETQLTNNQEPKSPHGQLQWRKEVK